MIRVTTIAHLLLSLGAPVSAAAVSAAAHPEDLLAAFRPIIYFEDDGPEGARADYPVPIAIDDEDIENNFAAGGAPPGAHAYAWLHETIDRGGRAVWVMEYHYYYRRNWTNIDFWLAKFRNFTHEHDWEWIYIVAGFDGDSLRPYCATFSAHAGDNRDLFSQEGAVRLFPGVTGGSVWKEDWARDPDSAPRVSLVPDGRVEATALATGNAFDGAPDQARSWIYSSDYTLVAYDGAQSSCGDAGTYFYGDPELPPGCFFCSGHAECVDDRRSPWTRDGLGDRDPLPADFALPSDWVANPSVEMPAPPASPILRLAPNPGVDWVRLEASRSEGPVRVELVDPAGRRVLELTLSSGESKSIVLSELAAGSYFVRAHARGRLKEVQHVTILH